MGTKNDPGTERDLWRDLAIALQRYVDVEAAWRPLAFAGVRCDEVIAAEKAVSEAQSKLRELDNEVVSVQTAAKVPGKWWSGQTCPTDGVYGQYSDTHGVRALPGCEYHMTKGTKFPPSINNHHFRLLMRSITIRVEP